jgi:hypothetical protein
MQYTVGSNGVMKLLLTGQAVGPQLSINNMGLATEVAYYSNVGWLVNAILLHKVTAVQPHLPNDANDETTRPVGGREAEAGEQAAAAAAAASGRGDGRTDVHGNRTATTQVGGIGDWAVIGPFNDTNSTGLFRAVSGADASGCRTLPSLAANTP